MSHIKVFVAIWELWQGQTFDGLCIYFHNKTYSLRFIVKALTIVGAHQTASIVKEAIDMVFPDGIPDSDSVVQEEAERIYFHDQNATSIRIALENLDLKFDLDPDRLPLLMLDFVRQYPEEFPIPDEDLVRAENLE